MKIKKKYIWVKNFVDIKKLGKIYTCLEGYPDFLNELTDNKELVVYTFRNINREVQMHLRQSMRLMTTMLASLIETATHNARWT